MIVITYIATILLLFIVPPLFIFAMIKPNKFQKLFKEGKVTRTKILGKTLLVGFILFVIVGLTAPPETEATKLARQAESTKIAEVNKIKNQESDQIKKIADMENAKRVTDDQNSKLASTVDLHNSNIIVETSDRVVYGIVPNSHQYDVRINLLDVNKKTVVTTDINHSAEDWSIIVDDKPVYDNGTIKYLTYSVSVNNKYYNSEKIIDISKDYKNYFKIVDSIKISNTKITKKDGKYIYLINSNSKVYDVRLDFVNSNNQVLLSKSLNHADKIWDITSTEAPLSSGGQISAIKTYVSIDSRYHTSTQQIDVKAVNYVDQDLIDETARQAELTRQAESARKAAADAAAKQSQKESQTSQSVYYKNCDAARAAGAAPIYEGQPGYRSKLDRDSDGVACE